MQELIDGKRKELKELGTVNRELKTWVDKSNLWYWVYSFFELEGIPVERRMVVDILDGKIVENATLDVYRLMLGFRDAYQDMFSSIEMGQDADTRLLMRWAGYLLDRDIAFRKGVPVIYEWNHIPPVAGEAESETIRLLRGYAVKRRSGVTLRDMAFVHLELLRLYAFGRDTIYAANLFLMYALLREGYLLPGFYLDDREYNRMIDDYINRGQDDFAALLERSVLNRLDSVLQLTRQAAENNDN